MLRLLTVSATGLAPVLAPVARAHAAGNERRVDACLDAYDQSQELRRRGALLRARDALLVCSRDPCPKALQGDCVAWLAEVETALPSVVFEARDPAGHDVTDVRVKVDDKPLLDRVDERAVSLDPGLHTFSFQSAAGVAPDQQVLLRDGAKMRAIPVQLGPRPDAPSGEAVASSAPSRLPAYVAGAAGVVALGLFAGFGLSGRASYESCASGCSDDERSSIKTRFTVADVSLGVSVVALGAAAYLFFRGGASASPAAPPPVSVGGFSFVAAADPRAPFVGLTYSR
jgi:hypothetical protein